MEIDKNKKYKTFFSTGRHTTEPEAGSSMERIYPSVDKMDAYLLQRLAEVKDMSDQKVQELEGSVGLVMA